jgi:hypothetical protein
MHERFKPLAGCDLRLQALTSGQTGEQQALHSSAARDASPEQSSGEDARVVDDKEVTGAKQTGKRRHGAPGQRSRVPAEDEEPSRRPFRRRFLGDQLGGEIEVEVTDFH